MLSLELWPEVAQEGTRTKNVRITSRSLVLNLPISASSTSQKSGRAIIGAAVTAAIVQEMDAYVFPVICSHLPCYAKIVPC